MILKLQEMLFFIYSSRELVLKESCNIKGCNPTGRRYIFYRALAIFFLHIHIYFCFLILFPSSQSNSEDFPSEDERLGFLSLGVRKSG